MMSSLVSVVVARAAGKRFALALAGLSVLSALSVLSVVPVTAQQPDEPEPFAAARISYAQYCSRCHGTDGGGGEGPSLLRSELEHAGNLTELTQILRQGIPGTAMPGHWQLSDADMAELVRYVHSLGQIPVEALTGDPERGAGVYEENGCEACHVLSGVGRGIGPELTRIGLQRGLDHLRQSLIEPEAIISEEYLFLRAHRSGGGTVEGLRINEDEFTVQIRDANGRFESLEKSELERIDRLRNRTIMRSYARSLDATELEDLVSFLATRRGYESARDQDQQESQP